MIEKLIPRALLLGLVLVGTTWATDPSLIGWWKLDELSGTVATDSSGQGNNGSLHGSSKHTAGKSGGGVYCDGTEAYVEIPGILTPAGTVAFWFKPDWNGTDPSDYWLFDASAGGKAFYIAKGSMNNAYFGFFYKDAGDAVFRVTITAAGAITAGTWYHVAATWEYTGGATGAGILYLNGVEVARKGGMRNAPTLNSKPRFGYATGQAGVNDIATHGAKAVIDDIKLFDRVLAANEIPDLMEGAVVEFASGPSPEDKGIDVPHDSALNWVPGMYAAAHDVYIGTDYNDVKDATAMSPLLVSTGLAATTYQPTGLFDFGQTYYWRVDEINAPNKPGFFKGNTWSFTAETYAIAITTSIKATASSQSSPQTGPEKTIDGSGRDDLDQHSTEGSDMWLSKKNQTPVWIQYEFDQVYSLHQMWVWNQNQISELDDGYGAMDVTIETSTDGITWTALANVPQFAQATAEDTYGHNTTVDFGDVLAKFVRLNILSNWGDAWSSGLAEVRFFYVPLKAFGPTPAAGGTGVAVDSLLNWRPGRKAASHEVYFGADLNVLTKLGTVTQHNYSLISTGVEYDKTYYWKVDEVNGTETWAGDVWSFSTAKYFVVDDFESYDDTCKRIFYTWVDGYGASAPECGGAPVAGNGTGASVGNPSAPYAEKTLIHSGRQSMPLFFDNPGATSVSEATRTFAVPQDWVQGGGKTLVLYFQGKEDNAAGQLYVKINNSKVVYNGKADVLTIPMWYQWNIDLASVGGNVRSVGSLTIGVSSSGKGKVLIDDILLYRIAPVVAQ